MPVTRAKTEFTPVAYLPGLESTQGPHANPPAYAPISFAADREYSEDEGWTTVHYRSKSKRKQRRWREVTETV